MEDFIKIIGAVIAVSAWIYSSLKTKAEEKVVPRPAPGAPMPLARETSVDQFLAEIRRRRDALEEQHWADRETEMNEPVPAPPPRRLPPPPVARIVEDVRPVVPAPVKAARPTLSPHAALMASKRTEVARDVAAMLKDRRALAAAFVLREILDEPLCKRGRRRFESNR